MCINFVKFNSLASGQLALSTDMDDFEVSCLYSLYFSRVLAAWGDRLWQFVGSLFLLSLDPGSLQLVAVYGLTSCLAVILSGSSLGSLVDRTQRMKMVSVAVLCQNLSVSVTCALVAIHFNVSIVKEADK